MKKLHKRLLVSKNQKDNCTAVVRNKQKHCWLRAALLLPLKCLTKNKHMLAT